MALVIEIFAKNLIKKIDSMEKSYYNFPESFFNKWSDGIQYQYEAKAQDCFIDSDGYWKLKNENHNGICSKFIWRIEPNYCTRGKPYFTREQEYILYKQSETKKVIFNFPRCQIYLQWDKFTQPTSTCWGLKMGEPYISINQDGENIYSGPSIHKPGWKKHLIDFLINDYGNIRQ